MRISMIENTVRCRLTQDIAISPDKQFLHSQPRGWYEEAAHHVSLAVEKYPTNEEYILTLGHIYFQLQQYSNASLHYSKIIQVTIFPPQKI